MNSTLLELSVMNNQLWYQGIGLVLWALAFIAIWMIIFLFKSEGVRKDDNSVKYLSFLLRIEFIII